MRFCPSCGRELTLTRLDGRDRGVCSECRFADWGLKVVSVGTAIRGSSGRFLLGRRAEQPAKGQWAIPGGYVEHDEVLHEAARREAREETGVEVEVGPVIAVRSMVRPHNHDTYVVFLATYLGGAPTPDALEFDDLRWFDPEDLQQSDVTAVTRQILSAAASGGSTGLSRAPYARRTGEPADLHLLGSVPTQRFEATESI